MNRHVRTLVASLVVAGLGFAVVVVISLVGAVVAVDQLGFV